MSSNENRQDLIIPVARRQSDQVVLRPSQSNTSSRLETQSSKRRKTLSGILSSIANTTGVSNSPIQRNSPPRKTPSKPRISLGPAHAYYFKSSAKTPLGTNTSMSLLNDSIQHDDGDVTANVADLSFLSLAESTSSNSTTSDPLNQSVLSDTTDLTAANFVLASSSRRRLSEFTRLAAKAKKKRHEAVTGGASQTPSKEVEPSDNNGTQIVHGTENTDLSETTQNEHSEDIAGTQCFPEEQASQKQKKQESEEVKINVLKQSTKSLGLQPTFHSTYAEPPLEDRRFSVGPSSTFRQTTPKASGGRKSWHGRPSDIGDVAASIQKYQELAETMKHVRQSRDQQRMDMLQRRLSSQSAASIRTERSTRGNAANLSFLSPPSDTSSSTGGNDTINLSSSSIPSEGDVSKSTLDDLFDGLISPRVPEDEKEANGRESFESAKSNDTNQGDNRITALATQRSRESDVSHSSFTPTSLKSFSSAANCASPASTVGIVTHINSVPKQSDVVRATSSQPSDNVPEDILTESKATIQTSSPGKREQVHQKLDETLDDRMGKGDKFSEAPNKIVHETRIQSTGRPMVEQRRIGRDQTFEVHHGVSADMSASTLGKKPLREIDQEVGARKLGETETNLEGKPKSPLKQNQVSRISLVEPQTSPQRKANPLNTDFPDRNTRSAARAADKELEWQAEIEGTQSNQPPAEVATKISTKSTVVDMANETRKIVSIDKENLSNEKSVNEAEKPQSTIEQEDAAEQKDATGSNKSLSRLTGANAIDRECSATEWTVHQGVTDDGNVKNIQRQSLDARATSPFLQHRQSSRITPTKLHASPRRMTNPLNKHSPARNTRSTAKLASKQLFQEKKSTSALGKRSSNHSPANDDTSFEEDRTSPNESRERAADKEALGAISQETKRAKPKVDSPASNTRNGKKKSEILSNIDEAPGSMIAHQSNDNCMDESPHNTGEQGVLRHANNTSILNSSLRKPGSARKRVEARHVEFGSPEFMEFNKSSPSMNLTPMPAKKLRVMDDLPEDTIEIEADMNALLNGVPPQSHFPSRNRINPMIDLDESPLQNASTSPIAESSSPSEPIETVQLELNMDDLLRSDANNVSQEISDGDPNNDMTLQERSRNLAYSVESTSKGDCSDSSMDVSTTMTSVLESHTVQLEENMSQVLEGTSEPQQKETSALPLNDSSVAVETQEIDTVALEENMTDLFKAKVALTKPVGGVSLPLVDGSRNPRKDSPESHLKAAPHPEEDRTVALELDMEALLKTTAGHNDHVVRASIDASPSTVQKRRRRSSLSSKRFSLVAVQNHSFSSDTTVEEDMEEEFDLSVDRGTASTDMTEALAETKDQNPRHIYMSWESTLRSLDLKIDRFSIVSDFLLEVTNRLEDDCFGETLNALYSQICDHVVDTTEAEIDLLSRMKPLEEQNESNLLSLQDAIERDETATVAEELAVLADNIQALETKTWGDWLLAVASTLDNPMEASKSVFIEKGEDVEKRLATLQTVSIDLASIDQRAGRRATRQRYLQQKDAMEQLEAEVAELNKELAESRGQLERVKSTYRIGLDRTQERSRHSSLTEQKDSIRDTANHLARTFSYSKGIHNWKTPNIGDGKVCFDCLAPLSEACVRLSFNMLSSGSVQCAAEVDRSIYARYPESRPRYRMPVAAQFLKSRTRELCREMSKVTLTSASRIGETLRRFEWQMGRLEQTGMELLTLWRRHSALLTHKSDPVAPSTFLVEVDFTGTETPSKLTATFELTTEYPFAPLDVSLDTFEGTIDVEKLRKLMIKNAKPGFGYLSRTCDVISAFLA